MRYSEMRYGEQRFNDIADNLESLPNDEKHFILWLLLREYNEENAKRIPERSDTIEDYKKEIFYHGLCAECNNLIDLLRFELWS